jgi:hypothetical protein
MSITANYPNNRPSLLLDFANTKALDPRITFSRPTTATYYNATTSAIAEQNLLIRSQDYSATWTVTNLTPVTGKTAPDSTSTATEFTAGAANGVLTQSVTAIAADYTFSVYLRRVTGTGNIDITAHSGGTWVTQTITSSWARYTVTQTLTAGTRIAGVRVVTSGDVIEVWGAQLEQRSSVTAYTATTTAAITNYIPVLQTASTDTARFDHNPTTRESLGLLIEEQRTNLLTYSSDYTNAAWDKSNAVSVTANANIAPDGTQTSGLLVENTANTNHYMFGTATTTAVSTTYSVYAKSAGRNYILLYTSAISGGYSFDLSLGVLGAVVGTAPTSQSITSVGNGWYRCSITFTATAASNTFRVQLMSSTTNNVYTGNGYSGAYIWGAQLEAGAFATSYIPTVASQVTRSADSASMTGTNFSSWYNISQGTFYSGFLCSSSSSDRVFTAVDSAINGRIWISSGDGAIYLNSTFQAQFSSAAGTSQAKRAITYTTNDAAGCLNAGTVGTDTSVIVPNQISQLIIGNNAANAGYLNGWIKNIVYYPIRVTNTNIQSLTGS